MKKYLLFGCAVGLTAMMLAGCGKVSQFNGSVTNSAAGYESAAETAASEDSGMGISMVEYGELEMEDGSVTKGAENDQTAMNRKLIKTVSMDVETEEFDSLINSIQSRINGLGGYIEDSSTNGNSYNSNRGRYASYTIRIPADKLDELVGNVSELANVTWKNESIKDVTLQYVDVESHKIALQTEQERLLMLMEKAETVEDLITIESRLSEIRYQIQSYESTLRVYDNQVNYSTLYLSISEVKKLTPQEEQNAWERIRDGFAENVEAVAVGIQDFFIEVVVAIPYLIIWGIVLFVGYKIGRKVIPKRGFKKKKKNQDVVENSENRSDTEGK